MQSKILSRRKLLIVVLAGFLFSSALFLDFLPRGLNLSLGKHVEQGEVSFGLPVRLKIPKINVDASVEYVGLTSDGAMDVPKERANTAWFNLGPHPGENGSAVIAGHYGWKNGEASVFDNLHKLRKGDKLYIEDDKGRVTSFVVRESRRYDPEADATEVFGASDDGAHLNLVTCEGTWDEVSKTYSKRLVVFTDKE